jgi:uncharacterized protein
MKLSVLSQETKPWYADGLRFTCSQCGNCCSGPQGFVWISEIEQRRLAEHLKISVPQLRKQYCRTIGSRVSLKEIRNSAGQYDCIFLEDRRVTDRQGVKRVQRVCSIYPVRPLQCRTWPFWDGNLSDAKVWNNSAKRCHGMNHGRHFSSEEMEVLRDAADWPERPPTSKTTKR